MIEVHICVGSLLRCDPSFRAARGFDKISDYEMERYRDALTLYLNKLGISLPVIRIQGEDIVVPKEALTEAVWTEILRLWPDNAKDWALPIYERRRG